METCWGIHAGKTGDADKLFLSNTKPCIAIGWDAMGNLSSIQNDRDAFKKKLIEAYPDTKFEFIVSDTFCGAQQCL